MTVYNALRRLPAAAEYKKGDVLVLCGELFGRGYANGIVDEARRAGMTIIGTTVGRRDGDGTLRSLTGEELAEAEANLGGKIINIPLEAGFDMEPCGDGRSLVEQLKGAKADDWDKVHFDWNSVELARQQGARRFTANLALIVNELAKMLPAGAQRPFCPHHGRRHSQGADLHAALEPGLQGTGGAIPFLRGVLEFRAWASSAR